jgi:6-phosphogluconolactonase/glucosamine-6-phosphate isomerase/deaminase
MNIKRVKDVARETSEVLNGFLKKNQSTLFFVSGGSAFDVLEKIDEKVLHKNLAVAMVDERFSADEKINNFLQLKQTEFFKKLIMAGGLFFDSTPVKGESIASLTQRFNSFLHTWKRLHPDGTVIALLGMGEDGHTAGIMPFPENKKLFGHLFQEEEWVVGYDAKDKNQYSLRITTTLTFLKEEVDIAIAYVKGENKKEALNRVLAEEGELAEAPARIWREMKGVEIYTDILV